MAGVVGTRTQIGVRDAGVKVEVAGDDRAKLMYYLNCMCYVVDLSSEGELRKLKDYRNFSCLTMEDEIKLVLLCLALNPVELTDQCIFKVPESIQGFHNKFLELNEARTTVLASNNVLIGGVSRKVTKIMMYKPSWMTFYYLEPIKNITEKQKRLINGAQSQRQLPAPQPSTGQYGYGAQRRDQSLSDQLETERKQRWKSEEKLDQLEQDNENMRQALEDLRQQVARKKKKSKCTIL